MHDREARDVVGACGGLKSWVVPACRTVPTRACAAATLASERPRSHHVIARQADRGVAAQQGAPMRTFTGFFIVAYLLYGCASSSIPHDDSPGATKRDSGPALCRDGSTPPCNDRD
jgi:hypothetical protein